MTVDEIKNELQKKPLLLELFKLAVTLDKNQLQKVIKFVSPLSK